MPYLKITPSDLHQLIVATRLSDHQLTHQALLELDARRQADDPIPMRLPCPECGKLHVDVALKDKPHHTHACQHCGMVWRPALVATVGVTFLPGFKDEPIAEHDTVGGAVRAHRRDLACEIVENGGAYQVVDECVHISRKELEALKAAALKTSR